MVLLWTRIIVFIVFRGVWIVKIILIAISARLIIISWRASVSKDVPMALMLNMANASLAWMDVSFVVQRRIAPFVSRILVEL